MQIIAIVLVIITLIIMLVKHPAGTANNIPGNKDSN